MDTINCTYTKIIKFFLIRIHFPENFYRLLSAASLKLNANWLFSSGLLSIFLIVPYHLEAQSFYRYHKAGQLNINGGIGITKYFGELADEKKLGEVNPHVTIGLTIPLKSRWSLRPEFSYYTISAADSDLPKSDSRKSRNLSFKSNNLEFSGLLIYGLHAKSTSLKISKLRPYLLAGIGVTYFNPKGKLDGIWYQLQAQNTEGIEYQKFTLIVPVGFGLAYKISSQWQLGLELSYRFTFTDFLDDVSTNYQDPNSFSNSVAEALADRRPEIGLDKAPAGSPRGNSDTNDGYLLFGVKVFHDLPGKGPLRRRR